MKEDFSLEQQVVERESRLGRKLTKDEFVELESKVKELERVNAEYDKLLTEHEKIRQEKESQYVFEQARDDAAKEKPYSKQVIEVAERIWQIRKRGERRMGCADEGHWQNQCRRHVRPRTVYCVGQDCQIRNPEAWCRFRQVGA